MSLFLRLSEISLGRYCRKCLAEIRGFGKKIKRVGWPYRGVVYRRGGSDMHSMDGAFYENLAF